MYFNNWARNGIKTINDLKDNDLIGFRTWENLCGTYGVKIPITEYYGLLQAIPAQWKQNLSETICSDQTKEPRYETVNYIYRNLNENCVLIVEKLIKWKEVFPLLELQEFVKCVRCIPRMTISVKLRSFQYRLLMNVVITNVHLKVLKLRSNNLCSFCDVETESLTHLFHNYQLVNPPVGHDQELT